ncbi:MAG: cytochrome c [Acidobacteriota bacterium]
MNLLKISVLVMVCCIAYACSSTSQNVAVSNSADPKPAQSANAAATPMATPAEVASGHDLYKANCAACHRENGTGGKIEIEGRRINPDNLTTDKIKGFSDDKIAGYIKNGVEDEGMPSFKDKLNDAEIAQVISYIRSDLQKR